MNSLMGADTDVRISDTIDAEKTAEDGWAASPAAVAKTQTYYKYTDHSAESDVAMPDGDNYVYVTGKNVDVYIRVDLSKAFGSAVYGAALIKNMPKPVTDYTLATFVISSGGLQGFGWITPDGTIISPANMPAGKFYIVAHYTTY